MGRSSISGRFFFSVGLGPIRIGTSSGGVLDGITGDGLLWLALFMFIGVPILAALFEAFFFIVFVLLISLVLVALSFAIFEFAIREQVPLGIHVSGASPILTPLGGLVLGIPTAGIYLLCLYRIPLVGRDWDYPNRIENCPKWDDTNLCEFTNIYGFASLGHWIMTLGVCTAYILIVFVVGFALRKKWLPLAELAQQLRLYQAWENSGRGGVNPFKGGALLWSQSAELRASTSRAYSHMHLAPTAEEVRQWVHSNPSGFATQTTPLWKRIQMHNRREKIRRNGGTPSWSDYPDWADRPRPLESWDERNRLRNIREAKKQSGQIPTLEDYPSYKPPIWLWTDEGREINVELLDIVLDGLNANERNAFIVEILQAGSELCANNIEREDTQVREARKPNDMQSRKPEN